MMMNPLLSVLLATNLLLGCATTEQPAVSKTQPETGRAAQVETPRAQPAASSAQAPIPTAEQLKKELGGDALALLDELQKGKKDVTVTATSIEIRSFGRRDLAFDCKDRVVKVQGSENTITLRGACDSLILNGAKNVIAVDKVKTIDLKGFENQVTWREEPRPQVRDRARGNSVQQAK